MLASFNHGDYLKEVLPLVGFTLCWLAGCALTLVAGSCLCFPKARPWVWRLTVLVALLGGGSISSVAHVYGWWNIGLVVWLAAGLPAAVSLGLTYLAARLPR